MVYIYHYVGKIISRLNDQLTVDYLRKSSNAFIFPLVGDRGLVDKDSTDIICKLKLINIQRGRHYFEQSLSEYIVR